MLKHHLDMPQTDTVSVKQYVFQERLCDRLVAPSLSPTLCCECDFDLFAEASEYLPYERPPNPLYTPASPTTDQNRDARGFARMVRHAWRCNVNDLVGPSVLPLSMRQQRAAPPLDATTAAFVANVRCNPAPRPCETHDEERGALVRQGQAADPSARPMPKRPITISLDALMS